MLLFEDKIFSRYNKLKITNHNIPSVYIQRRGGGPLHAVMVDINLRLRSPDLRCARARAPPFEALLESGSGICNIVRGKTRSFLHTAACSTQPLLFTVTQPTSSSVTLISCSGHYLQYLDNLHIYRSSHKISTLSKDCSGGGEIQTL